MEFTNEQLVSYSKPVSNTEEEKCKNAINMIGKALINKGFVESQSIRLSVQDTYAYESRFKKNGREIKLLVQGSYANNTNVRANSDVDVAVIQEDVFNTVYRTGVEDSTYGFTTNNYGADQYKKDVYEDLVSQFGVSEVHWKNKCLSIEGNSYRTPSDAVPARRYRDYRNDYSNDANNYHGGIRIVPDNGLAIVNYPEQHIKNGREKNIATHQYYKKM